jgi:hypothetical protein
MSGFEDYTSAQETKQKLLRDVFERGDAWYRNGHLTGKDAGDFFISSTASAIPSAGGAGMSHVGSRGSNHGLPGCHRAQRLRREAARHRRRRWHDSYRDGKRTRLRTPVAAGTPARSFCVPWARDHRDIQTHEGGPFVRWLRSHRHQRCIYCDDAAKGRFVGLHRALYGRLRPVKCASNGCLQTLRQLNANVLMAVKVPKAH